MPNEKSLIERARGNDPDAFAQIYETYFDRIYRYVFIRVRTREEAEDMTQQVFLNALQSISSYKWKGIPFSAWLFRIAHNQVIDYQRKSSRVQVMDIELPLQASEPDPVDAVEKEIEMERVRGAMKNLTDLQQEVISLRFAGGLSTKETAKVMGKNEGSVKALQHSALGALRRALFKEETYVKEA